MNAAGILAPLPLVRLLQLASPALPIGAYSYSQGVEWIVANGDVHDAASAERWIGEVMEHVVARGEAAMLWRLLRAAVDRDWSTFEYWNAWFRASRETAELRAETEQMGGSLAKLTIELELVDAPARAALASIAPVTLPAAYAIAARAFGIPPEPALVAYLWSWLENQVLAAMKLVPLGQRAGQRLLHALGTKIPVVAVAAGSVADDDVASFAPGLALASSRHETQYTRLFRS
jgi:urease accessory protein